MLLSSRQRQVAYDKCWDIVQKSEGNMIDELKTLAAQLDEGLLARPRQFVRVPVPKHATAVLLNGGREAAAQHGSGSFSNRLNEDTMLGTMVRCRSDGTAFNMSVVGAEGREGQDERGPLAPVACLDQLLAQALGADRLVRPKVQAWGVASGAYYRLVGTHSHVTAFEPWADLHGYPGGGDGSGGSGGRVRWAQCKSRKRAVEKLYRVYRLDVSLLVRPNRTKR